MKESDYEVWYDRDKREYRYEVTSGSSITPIVGPLSYRDVVIKDNYFVAPRPFTEEQYKQIRAIVRDEVKQVQEQYIAALNTIVAAYEEKLNELRTEGTTQRRDSQDEVPF